LILSGQKVEVPSKEEVAEYTANFKKLLEESPLVERKAFIRSFVKELKVTRDDVLLTYTLPILPLRVIEEKLPILSIVHYSGR
jgi:site-specific DNA recombinase